MHGRRWRVVRRLVRHDTSAFNWHRIREKRPCLRSGAAGSFTWSPKRIEPRSRAPLPDGGASESSPLASAVFLDDLVGRAIDSRLEAVALREHGLVSVGGAVTLRPLWISSAASVAVSGHQLQDVAAARYLVDKPRGYVCDAVDALGRTHVRNLLPDASLHVRVAAALPSPAAGLVLLSNRADDRRVEQRVRALYSVEIDRCTREQWAKLQDPVRLSDGWASPLKLEDLTESHAVVSLTESRRNQVFRMFGAVGARGRTFRRIGLGGLWSPEPVAADFVWPSEEVDLAFMGR